MLGALTYFTVKVFPLLTRKINPVYAAKVVEESQPSIKNSLINYILLRRSKNKVSRSVVNAIGSGIDGPSNNYAGVKVIKDGQEKAFVKCTSAVTGDLEDLEKRLAKE